jgi:hypothetical protein
MIKTGTQKKYTKGLQLKKDHICIRKYSGLSLRPDKALNCLYANLAKISNEILQIKISNKLIDLDLLHYMKSVKNIAKKLNN